MKLSTGLKYCGNRVENYYPENFLRLPSLPSTIIHCSLDIHFPCLRILGWMRFLKSFWHVFYWNTSTVGILKLFFCTTWKCSRIFISNLHAHLKWWLIGKFWPGFSTDISDIWSFALHLFVGLVRFHPCFRKEHLSFHSWEFIIARCQMKIWRFRAISLQIQFVFFTANFLDQYIWNKQQGTKILMLSRSHPEKWT